MTALQVSALTDFLLACLAFFCAGALAARPAQPLSAAWHWRAAMFCLALAALLGGTDHGFVEPAGLSRAPIQRATWAVLGLMTTAVLLTLGAHFLRPAHQRLLRRLAAVQLLASAVQALGIDAFSPLDHDGLYHLISMPGVVLLYFGGRRLKTLA